MRFPKLFVRFTKFLRGPRYRVMPSALGFFLDHKSHVIEQHHGIGELLSFYPSTRITVNEIPGRTNVPETTGSISPRRFLVARRFSGPRSSQIAVLKVCAD